MRVVVNNVGDDFSRNKVAGPKGLEPLTSGFEGLRK